MACGGGTEGRNRTIAVPAQNGGTKCAGNATDAQDCNTHPCPGKKRRGTSSYFVQLFFQSDKTNYSVSKCSSTSYVSCSSTQLQLIVNGLSGANGQVAQWPVVEELRSETGQLQCLLRMVVLNAQEIIQPPKIATHMHVLLQGA